MKASILLVITALASCPGPRTEVPEAITATVETVSRHQSSSEATRGAIRRSLPFLEDQGIAWMEGRVAIQEGAPCVSCHHVGFSLWSQKEARRVGVEANDEASGETSESLAETASAFVVKPGTPRAFSAASVLLGLPNSPREEVSERLIQALLDLQTRDGAWEARGQFPTQRRPRRESDAVATLWTLLALAPETDRAPEIDRPPALASRTKGLAWLDEEQGDQETREKSTEWLAAHLVVAEALADSERVGEMRLDLLDRQNDDGGWGWLPGDPSEAFSTGQALYALARIPSGDKEPMERAVRHLLQSQDQDGTWKVASAAISQEPSAAKDVIYRFWSTAWATLGLSRSLAPAVGALLPEDVGWVQEVLNDDEQHPPLAGLGKP